MTPDELETLMSAVASSDRRTTGKADVNYWALMAAEGRWTYRTAMRALVIYRTEHPGEWIDPGHITTIIREARRRAAETFVVPDEPADLPGDQLPAWHRARLDEHIRRVLDAWADGAPIPVTTQAAAELTGSGRPALEAGLDTSTCPPHLRDEIERGIARIGREKPGPRPAVRVPRRMAGDPERRAAARAELAERQPAPLPGDERDEPEAESL